MARAYPSTTSTTLCDLPAELILEIVHQLDNPALLNLGLTCHFMQRFALCTLFVNNNIGEPTKGSLIAYNAPIEILPALRCALFIQRFNQVDYYFYPCVERMLREVQELRGFISRMPAIGSIRLHFSAMDSFFGLPGFDRQSLNPAVWQKEFQGLLEVVLQKGCSELYVDGGQKLIELYVEAPGVHQKTTLRKKRKTRKKSVKGARNGKSKSLGKAQEVTHSPVVPMPVLNIKPSRVFIHSKILLLDPFFNWTVVMLNSGASTISHLSLNIHGLTSICWKSLLDGVNLPKLLDFEITCDSTVPFQGIGVVFADVHSFLARHPNIRTLKLYGAEVPEGVWPPPFLDIPILPQLGSITGHPFYLIWIINGLLLDKEASPNLFDITISAELPRSAPYTFHITDFDYALFDDALELIATFPNPRDINLTLRFGPSDINWNWFEKHLATTIDASPSSIISRLDNVTTLTLSSVSFVDWMTVAVLPDWLALFPNLTVIRLREQFIESVDKLLQKEFVKNLAMACPKVEQLDVQFKILYLDRIRKKLVVRADPEDGQESGRDVST